MDDVALRSVASVVLQTLLRRPDPFYSLRRANAAAHWGENILAPANWRATGGEDVDVPKKSSK